MKRISDSALEQFESTAVKGALQIEKFFETDDDELRNVIFNKAKLGAAAISGYARVVASENNRVAMELALQNAEQRTPKQLPSRKK